MSQYFEENVICVCLVCVYVCNVCMFVLCITVIRESTSIICKLDYLEINEFYAVHLMVLSSDCHQLIEKDPLNIYHFK